MTNPELANYFAELDRLAKDANVAEDEFRRNIAKRIRELEEQRAFAFRRMNLMKSVAQAVTDAKDEEEAKAKARDAFLAELDWTGGSQFQRDVVEKFMPVGLAVWEASKPDAKAEDVAKIGGELAAFEEWFAQQRETPFLAVMEKQMVELPLVERA
ncbi:MAG: hypothetical protein KF826_08915 [Xanthobacteraceae bacterium]|nr:hypothetical protein [Xanthobacteraceae bacterium]MBX3534459.1 hypothetical protein [Xanthobacteraceae bacterium]MBX3547886.1 hypothetical protein [Xanthobacteraceae bacterium]MCW5677038.1 hypothetical protein [Xanthobacteraceae bacterium]